MPRTLPASLPARRRLEQRHVVLGAAALLALATVVARELVPGNRDELLGLMFVIPVALAGLELGTRGGMGLAFGTLLFVALRGSHSEPRFDEVGLAMRGIVFLGVGALAGRFSDRMRAFQLHQAQLLTVERERAALTSELDCVERRLEDQLRNAGRILDFHEREKQGIAEQLHEQAAQAMAATLLVVGRLERDIVDELTQTQLQRARSSVGDCIAELRRLAGSLRSPVLEELGLKPALERLCERTQQERSQAVELSMRQPQDRLPADVEISAYRVIADVLDTLYALDGAAPIHVRLWTDACSLKIELRARCASAPADRAADCERLKEHLIAARARLEIVGGSLTSSDSSDVVAVAGEIPLG